MTSTMFSAPRSNADPSSRVAAYRTQRTRPLTPGETVYLDGNALLDPSALGTDTQFAWSFVRRPDRSRAAISQPTACRASFMPDIAGRYLIRLDARTSSGNVRVIKEVRVSQDEMTPVAVARAESALVMTGAPIRLSGTSSENPLAGTLTYDWRITAAPSGSIATLSYAASEAPMIFPDMEGRYEVTLTVRNVAGAGTTDTVAISVVSPKALSDLTEKSAHDAPTVVNFGRTYTPSELKALRRAVRVTRTRPRTEEPAPRDKDGGVPGKMASEALKASSPRYASLIGHIRMLLRDGVESITRQVDSTHDFHQPAISRR